MSKISTKNILKKIFKGKTDKKVKKKVSKKKVVKAKKTVKAKKIILDPVMVAKGGFKLINDTAVKILKEKLIKKVYLIILFEFI